MTKRREIETGAVIRGTYGQDIECLVCGQRWSPNIQPGGRMPRNYRVCPNKCSREDLK